MRLPKHVYLNPFFRICGSSSEGYYIFVVGAPRSGTTLLANVISNHSNVCSVKSETGLFSWRTCFLLMEGNAGRNSEEFHTLRRSCRNVVQLMDKIADCELRSSQSKWFLEKTPQHVFHLGFILKHFPNARVVNIIRDPRDGYVSSRSNSYVIQGRSPRSFARYWHRCILARRKYENHSSILDVFYEKFVSNPERELDIIMKWLGEEKQNQQLDPKFMRKDPRAGSEQFRHLGGRITNSSVGRWKNELSNKEVAEIERAGGIPFYELYGKTSD